MESFAWNNNFITGLSIVDEEHRHLVDLINKFGDLLVQNELHLTDFEAVYTELAEYAQGHFVHEGELMEHHGVDPRHIRKHKEEHDNFIQEVSSMRASITPEIPDLAKPLLKFLTSWLAYHILCTDKNMARQIESIKNGQTADAAYDEQERILDSTTEPLVEAMNILFEQVSLRNRELVELNQGLEAKVDERTRELRDTNLQLEKMALTDMLTGLPNRRHGMRRLEQLWNESTEKETPLACIMIDADGFKEINDTYGHDAGDVVLQELSRVLDYTMRSDDIVCRLGGDEFLIICPNTHHEGAMQVAETTCETINAMQVSAGEGKWYGSISVGVAVRSPGINKVDALIKAADEGVYHAKKAGKNCVKSSGCGSF